MSNDKIAKYNKEWPVLYHHNVWYSREESVQLFYDSDTHIHEADTTTSTC